MINKKINHYQTIKQMPLEVRPRERLFHYGVNSLSDAELLAIIMGTGREGESVLGLSLTILSKFESLSLLSKASFQELMGINGVGKAKAAQVMAAFELGRRLTGSSPAKRIALSNPEDVANLLIPKMRHLEKEYFKALVLNVKNELLKETDISIGSLNCSIVHPRELFKAVIKYSGSGVIVAHNHPSGDPNPSKDDVLLTERLTKSAEILGIDLIDHVIIGDGEYASLKELGYF